MLDALIGGAGKVLDFFASKDANEKRQEMANAEAARQYEFAQKGIGWRVQDAKNAGVHPLFALGASTASYSPQSIGIEKESLGGALAEMGQGVQRAVNAEATQDQRKAVAAFDAVKLEGLKLDNDIKRASLASELKKLQPPAVGPGLPSIVPEANKFEDRPKLSGAEGDLATNPNITNADDFEKRYGELTDWVYGPQIFARDELDRAGGYELNKALRAVLVKMGVLNPRTRGDELRGR